MNSIFMTKYANLSTINKFNKYASSSKKIPLSLKRRIENNSDTNLFSNTQKFNHSNSKKSRNIKNDFPMIEAKSYLFKPKSERNTPFKIKTFSLNLKSFEKNSFKNNNYNTNYQNTLSRFSSDSNIFTFNNQSIHSSLSQNNILLENQTSNTFQNNKQTNFISFGAFKPKNTFDQVLKKIRLKKIKKDSLNIEIPTSNLEKKIKSNSISPKDNKNSYYIKKKISKEENDIDKNLSKTKSDDLIIYENTSGCSENITNNQLNIKSERNYEKKTISNIFNRNNSQVFIKKKNSYYFKTEENHIFNFIVNKNINSERAINLKKKDKEKPIKINNNIIEKKIQIKKKNSKKNEEEKINNQPNEDLKKTNNNNNELLEINNLEKKEKTSDMRNQSFSNFKKFQFLSKLNSINDNIYKKNKNNSTQNIHDIKDYLFQNKENFKKINLDLKKIKTKEKRNTTVNIFRKNNSFQNLCINPNLMFQTTLYKHTIKTPKVENINNKFKILLTKKKKEFSNKKREYKKKIFKKNKDKEKEIINSNPEANIKTSMSFLRGIQKIEPKQYGKEDKEIKIVIHYLKKKIFGYNDLYVQSPYEKTYTTLINIKDELTNKEYKYEYEYQLNITQYNIFEIYQLTNLNFIIHFLSQKYFDFYNEFVRELNMNNKRKEHSATSRFRKIHTKTQKLINLLKHFKKDELKNSIYIHKFIRIDNLYDTQIKTENLISHKSKKSKNISFSTKIEDKEKNMEFKIFHFHRISEKLENYSCLKRKTSFMKLINLRPKKNRLSFIVLNEKFNQENVFKQLKIYLIKNDIPKFKKLFIQHMYNINIEKCDELENSLLMLSVIYNCKEILEFLIERGANVNTQNIYLNTPLHYASSNKNYKIIDILIKNGANEKIKNRFGQSYFECGKLEH